VKENPSLLLKKNNLDESSLNVPHRAFNAPSTFTQSITQKWIVYF